MGVVRFFFFCQLRCDETAVLTLASLFLFSFDLIFLRCSQLLVYVAGGPSSGSDRGPPFSSRPLFLLLPLPINKPDRSGGFREQSIYQNNTVKHIRAVNCQALYLDCCNSTHCAFICLTQFTLSGVIIIIIIIRK